MDRKEDKMIIATTWLLKITFIGRAEEETCLPRRIGLKSIDPSEILTKIAPREHLSSAMLDNMFIEEGSDRRSRSENSWWYPKSKKYEVD